jgi:hypothetical protein
VRKLIVAVLAAAVLVPAASASNGVELKSAAQIVAAATKAGETAQTVHVSATIGKLSFDLQLVAGKGGKGKMVQSGASFDIVRLGTLAYFRGSDKFWKRFVGASGVALFHGKWMRAPATKGDLASLTPLTDLHALIKQSLGSHGKLVKGKTLTFHGQHVVAVRDVTRGGTLYVSTDGAAYPVALANAKKGGIVYFDRWNAPVTVSAPAKSIDITKLKK